MPNYLRARDPGGTFFFTLVTERRQPILMTDLGRQLLSNAIRIALAERPVIVQAGCHDSRRGAYVPVSPAE